MSNRWKQVKPPEWAGAVVDICIYRDTLLIACQYGVFKEKGGELVPMLFVNKDQGALTDQPPKQG